ncbi:MULTISPECIES: helix-turn-helix transcriptional regulator [Luteibacter]|uniref:Helix-turn-helix transcriptional regulator n=1 Tax=Luteibacter flocculans TaxID=2780091 RepID=A0ABY4T4K0_9GAMM|nr:MULTISPECIES: AraC family transcriptional regulator [Luteibacter]URL59037.1 helix-turn-helix transcriptional regulator [Luteibacter flocculans]SFW56050.1 AraC-type DNA-binding protein [Luteibacter sp. UNCMF366Tsu5.1]
MYRAEHACSPCRQDLPTVFVDLAQRSAAVDRGGRHGGASLLDDLRGRAQLTEILVDGDAGDLLLVYRAACPADAVGAGAILFRRPVEGDIDTPHPPAVRTLAQVLFDSLRAEAPNTPLLAHVALALRAILGAPSARDDAGTPRGGLATWQERRAIAFMDERLDQSFPVSAVADVCGLSVNHFSRAFRRSTGKPPHRWLLDRRIERSRQLLRDTQLSLADIALACGFAEQSHFTRVFTRTVGMPPGAWRRATD